MIKKYKDEWCAINTLHIEKSKILGTRDEHLILRKVKTDSITSATIARMLKESTGTDVHVEMIKRRLHVNSLSHSLMKVTEKEDWNFQKKRIFKTMFADESK